ncbi:MAG: protease inhibitor I42 family protein [Gammaproteobacteria bacterium]|nr:protease inhibitor I42 family protein [Gammaproteobacteria bacterium]
MMKNRMRFLWLIALLLPIVVQAQVENGAIFTDSANVITVQQSNPVFDITLKSNPSTGYSWMLKSYDENLISQAGHAFYPPSSSNDKPVMVGKPGYEKWTFKIKPESFSKSRTTKITMVYKRSWEDQEFQTLDFTVEIQNAN